MTNARSRSGNVKVVQVNLGDCDAVGERSTEVWRVIAWRS